MKPPNALSTPLLLQEWQWVADPVGYMENAAKQHPDMFSAGLLSGRHLVFVNHPQAIQEVLTSDRKRFIAPGESNRILSPLIGDASVIMLDGDRHKRRRQLLMPPFHGERMRAYGDLICQLTEKVMSQHSIAQPFNMRSTMQEISLQVILEAVFGVTGGEQFEPLRAAITKMCELFHNPLSASFLFFPWMQRDLGAWMPWGRFLRDRGEIDKLLYAEIADRRRQDNRDRVDILSMLLAARDENGEPMTDPELRDELMTLLFAGHETTATAMAWALYWIHHLPEVREKLLQEIAALGDDPDPMSLARLPYLSAVCNETLRLYPVAMLTFSRIVNEPLELLGHPLQPGTAVVGCIYLLHHREDLYPDSHQFKPERFLEQQFSLFEFMPFGGGARRCIGEALAMFEMKLVLATILSRFELALVDRRPEVPRRRGVTLAPSGKVKIQIVRKKPVSAAIAQTPS
ncbi:cytochrome P450 [Leptolyngbya sp. NIES-2104]|uniref:cytochrome P450 n=1 Tax=Leptolyngbya sp. NIES-2104 TaxID=1552121 RepID=UPI0006EC697E|nr:cytochrome P450 [Leptolyngbya sp. NIES-2104]GAP96292.1 cytochrome P450 [Leptolyngbya sp. NIES-2104]